MVRRSAGLLLFRRTTRGPEVLIAHMGGPFWARRGRAWSIPKGEYEADEEALVAARREFVEELGLPPPTGRHLELGELRQPSGKIIIGWAVEGDLDPAVIVPGTFTMEWPRGSGQVQAFPEIDRVEWVELDEARRRLVAGQVGFLDRLAAQLDAHWPVDPEPGPSTAVGRALDVRGIDRVGLGRRNRAGALSDAAPNPPDEQQHEDDDDESEGARAP